MPLNTVMLSLVWCAWLSFFSSRRRHTRLVSDWSSDVCSSDLGHLQLRGPRGGFPGVREHPDEHGPQGDPRRRGGCPRSEERRVGKERRTRRAAYHLKQTHIMQTVKKIRTTLRLYAYT